MNMKNFFNSVALMVCLGAAVSPAVAGNLPHEHPVKPVFHRQPMAGARPFRATYDTTLPIVPKPERVIPAPKARPFPSVPKAKKRPAILQDAVRQDLPHHPRHHWRPVVVNVHVWTRPAVVLVNQVWVRDPMLQGEAEMLREAYLALSRASLDYDGHRFGAMRQTAIGANDLGLYLRGDGSGDESPEASNAQMEMAGNLLSHVYDGLAAKGYADAADHVDAAIQEISHALNWD